MLRARLPYSVSCSVCVSCSERLEQDTGHFPPLTVLFVLELLLSSRRPRSNRDGRPLDKSKHHHAALISWLVACPAPALPSLARSMPPPFGPPPPLPEPGPEPRQLSSAPEAGKDHAGLGLKILFDVHAASQSLGEVVLHGHRQAGTAAPWTRRWPPWPDSVRPVGPAECGLVCMYFVGQLADWRSPNLALEVMASNAGIDPGLAGLGLPAIHHLGI